MGFFKGQIILDKGGNQLDAEAKLHGKVILVYFSAHWCPPCRAFTPKLKDCFEDLVEEGKDIAIVFVSSDRSKGDMDSYFKESHGDWYCLPYGSNKANELKKICQVQGIPTLVVMDSDGNMLHQSARSDVEGISPAEAFKKWEKMTKK